MKLYTDTPIVDIHGEQFIELVGKNQKEQPVTLRYAVMAALLANEQIDAPEKLKRFDLAMRLQKANGSVELTVDDAALIKQCCGKSSIPLVYGQVHHAIEGAAK